ncbi:MAG: hypothetical protein AAF414_24915 [Pseudomonadota bacterium]
MRRLGEMMGDIPGELGQAELAMRDAERALSDRASRAARLDRRPRRSISFSRGYRALPNS